MKRVVGLVAAVTCMVLSGCASPDRRAPAEAAALQNEVVAAKPKKPKLCREEAPMDSIIKRTRCISEEEFERQREEADRAMEQ